MIIETGIQKKQAKAFSAEIDATVPTALNKGKKEQTRSTGRPWTRGRY